MAWRRYVNFFILGVIVFGAALALVILRVSPDNGYFGFGAFFLSFFLFLMCFFSVIGFYMRRRISNNEVLYYNLKTAFRQGTIAALYFTLILIMQAASLLNWWDAILLGLALVFFDMFFKEKS